MIGKTIKTSIAILYSCLAVLTIVSTAIAEPTATAWGKIFVVGTGPKENRIRIKTTAGDYDVGCNNKDKEYTTDPKSPSTKLIHDLIRQALFNGNEVQLILEGCYKGAPRITDIYIRSTN